MTTVCNHAGVKDLADTGFENMLLDLSVFCSPWELEKFGEQESREKSVTDKQTEPSVSQHPSELSNRVEKLMRQCRKAGLHILIARAPYLAADTKRMDLNSLLLRLALESIACCARAGCGFLIVKPIFSGVERGDEWSANREFYLSLAKTAREYGVTILLENQCQDLNGHLVRGLCSDAEQAAAWIDRLNKEAGNKIGEKTGRKAGEETGENVEEKVGDRVGQETGQRAVRETAEKVGEGAGEAAEKSANEECFGFCMDVGVSSLCGQNMYDFVVKMGNRLKAVIVRDGDGRRENALLPFTAASRGQSGTDWLNLIRGLRKIGFDGQLIIDFRDTVRAFPLTLRRELTRLAKQVADYFVWQIEMERVLKQYDSVALFGAGNMCRNYMKCYGEKYPPLFTCDNNRKLWGTAFCGLQVEPPERLKELPEGCAILICNIYYREIREQLRDMGVKNPIAFFNDAYMPSYHFDRLEMWKPPV